MATALPRGIRVLLVEDDEMVSKLLQRALGKWFGRSVHIVRNGEGALSELDAQPFDLVVTDLKIPGPNGLEVARRARNHEPPAAVVVVTGYADREEEAFIEACGAALLRKPFDSAELETAVRGVLERAGH